MHLKNVSIYKSHHLPIASTTVNLTLKWNRFVFIYFTMKKCCFLEKLTTFHHIYLSNFYQIFTKSTRIEICQLHFNRFSSNSEHLALNRLGRNFLKRSEKNGKHLWTSFAQSDLSHNTDVAI